MLPTQRFNGLHILVGITGGIAAYKSCELVRYLVKSGAEVRVAMTANAERFITPLTLETLSNHPVYRDMFPEAGFVGTHHIALADWAQAVMVVPATANLIGKLASGIADDFLSTVLMAVHCPVVVAPAMNSHMWENPIVSANVQTLTDRLGYIVCPPEEGFLAEGYSGVGRLPELDHLMESLYMAVHPHRNSLNGKAVLITAGRTEEALDPVRILTNRASGRMGFAVALEAWALGAQVTLVHGPTELRAVRGIRTIAVTSAGEMLEAVKQNFPGCDIFVGCAAVADYRPEKVAENKLKKSSARLSLALTRTTDILSEMSVNRRSQQRLVGFALETENILENARKKLTSKRLDLIVINNPLEKGAGFAHDTNRVTLLSRGGMRELELQYKLDVAAEIFETLATADGKN